MWTWGSLIFVIVVLIFLIRGLPKLFEQEAKPYKPPPDKMSEEERDKHLCYTCKKKDRIVIHEGEERKFGVADPGVHYFCSFREG